MICSGRGDLGRRWVGHHPACVVGRRAADRLQNGCRRSAAAPKVDELQVGLAAGHVAGFARRSWHRGPAGTRPSRKRRARRSTWATRACWPGPERPRRCHRARPRRELPSMAQEKDRGRSGPDVARWRVSTGRGGTPGRPVVGITVTAPFAERQIGSSNKAEAGPPQPGSRSRTRTAPVSLSGRMSRKLLAMATVRARPSSMAPSTVPAFPARALPDGEAALPGDVAPVPFIILSLSDEVEHNAGPAVDEEDDAGTGATHGRIAPPHQAGTSTFW